MRGFSLGTIMTRLILASASPYRKALLERLNLPFEGMASEVNEEQYKEDITDALELTKILAQAKARSIYTSHQDAFVIGGDQVSLFNHEILGKPHTEENAIKQLLKLQGQTHELVTATCLLGPEGYEKTWVETIKLTMRPLSESEVTRYVQKERPLDCAGSYKIEGLGISLFEKIEGHDQTSIIGMPLMSLASRLREVGFQVP
jgi:septum formation protein